MKEQININKIELLIINNSLNEVINGLAINDFQSIIGVSKESSEKLLKQIDRQFKLVENESEEKSQDTEFDLEDLKIIKKSINMIKEELDEIDFTTRIGASKDEIDQLLLKIEGVITSTN